MSDFIPMKNKSASSFDVLPNEILSHIFHYLTSNDIIYAFFDYNQRLQNLLLTQKFHFKLPTTNLNFWRKTMPLIGPQIETLTINFHCLTLSLDFFSNLTSIIIDSPYSSLDGQLQYILDHQCFQQLHTFKIKDVILSKQSGDKNVLHNEKILFKKIFDNNNNLQVFEYLPELRVLCYEFLRELNSNTNIRALTLNLPYFGNIFDLIQHTPNLVYLNIQSKMPYQEFKEHSGRYDSTDEDELEEYSLKNIRQIQLEKYLSKNIHQINLEEFHLKFKPTLTTHNRSIYRIPNCDILFDAIQLFSSSLITLSLNFIEVEEKGSIDVLFDGMELEKKLLKPMKKLQNLYFYASIHQSNDVQEVASKFQTFPWSIGVHKKGYRPYLYSLPFPFHELKHFRDFQDVLSNNEDILKHHHRLWSNVTSLELTPSDPIDFQNLFQLIKVNMPKISSITFHGSNDGRIIYENDDDDDDDDDSWNEMKRINVQLDSVTTVRLKYMSMKQIEQILIHSFPNLQCLIFDHTKLPSKENELMSFLGQKLQRIEFDEFFLWFNTVEEINFNYFLNVQHIKLAYAAVNNDGWLNSRSRIIYNLLTKLPKLQTLSIYAIPSDGWLVDGPEVLLKPLVNGLNQHKITAEYGIKYFGDYMWFIRYTVGLWYL